ncbi:MAG: hypothetical protein FWC51_00795 [Proteobacteria bacterium]|nr:hypothetical protein [Pseudomonadota bacterium]
MSRTNKFKTILMIGIIFSVVLIITGKVQSNWEKGKTDQRTKDFAKYIFDDVRKVIEKHGTDKDVQEFLEFAKKYKKSPEYYDQVIARWMADSTLYADAIARDAEFIHQLDAMAGKSVSFEAARQAIENASGPAESYDGSSHGVHLKKVNKAKTLQINTGYLEDASVQLKIARGAKKIAVK